MVVAYALAGTLDIDLEHQPLGKDSEGKDVYLKEIWPEPEEITDCIHNYVKPELFSENYNGIFKQNKVWNRLVPPVGETYEWDEKSTYLASAPFF
jgi:aconitate hydratase